MRNSSLFLDSQERKENNRQTTSKEISAKTSEDLVQLLNAESYKEEEIKKIYGLEGNFVSRMDKKYIEEQNKPENLIALSEYFLKHPEYDEDLSLQHVSKLPRGFHFPKNLKGTLSFPNLVTRPEGVNIPIWVTKLNLPKLKKYPNNSIFPENLEELTIGIEELLDPSPISNKLKKLQINQLKSLPENMVFPEWLRFLSCNSIKSRPKSVLFPQTIKNFYSNLSEIEGEMIFPKEMQALELPNLKSLQNITLPEVIIGTCFLDNIEIITKGTRIPKGGTFRFTGLKKIEKDVIFLGEIDILWVQSLESWEIEKSDLPTISKILFPKQDSSYWYWRSTPISLLADYFKKNGTKITWW